VSEQILLKRSNTNLLENQLSSYSVVTDRLVMIPASQIFQLSPNLRYTYFYKLNLNLLKPSGFFTYHQV